MLAVAREKTKLPQVTYVRGDMAETAFPPESFDVVLSSLAIHYLPSFTDFLNRVRQCLVPGGDFVFSVWSTPSSPPPGPRTGITARTGRPLHFPVDRYFEEGRRTARFLGEDVVKYHRTLTTYLDGLLTGGFELLRGGGAPAAGADAGPAGDAGRAPPPHDAAGGGPEASGVTARRPERG